VNQHPKVHQSTKVLLKKTREWRSTTRESSNQHYELSLVPKSCRFQDFQRQIDNIEKLYHFVQYKGTLLSLKRYRKITLFGINNYHQWCQESTSEAMN